MLHFGSMYSSVVDLPSIRQLPDWQRWRTLTAKEPPYLAPEFFTLAARFADGKPVVVEAWEDDEHMIGALPLVRKGDRLGALRCDFTPGYDYAGSEQGVELIWQALREDTSWNELDIAKLPRDSMLASHLPALATKDGFPVTIKLDSRHPYFALDDFEAAMSPKFRTNLRRCDRKAGGVELERIAVPDRAAFDEALAIEAMAWKGAAGTSIEADPDAVHFYRVLSRLLGRRGFGQLYFLRSEGRRIAMLFALEDGHTLYALKIGYDPAVSNLSPGHLIVWKVAADAAARGLKVLDFVGRDDGWKRKWTDRVHEHVEIKLFRPNAIGLARYASHNLLKPHLPPALRNGIGEVLPRSCQKTNIIGAHSIVERLRGRVTDGLGIKSGIKSAVRQAFEPWAKAGTKITPDPLGKPSAFAPGSWVRVKPAADLRVALDEHDKTRGLLFTQAQWDTAGEVFQVSHRVRRMRDDHGTFRPISRTVLLEGVDCAGHSAEPAGCGRHCPMMYRDEWLEPAEAPPRGPTPASTARHVRVKNLEDIRAGLDLWGKQDGLTFMPEMAAYAGKRFAIANKITSVFEYDRWVDTKAPAVYVLEGLHCAGELLEAKGPCDRKCSLLWHEDWLVIEP